MLQNLYKKSFTLIEMLIVIVIIGILAAVFIPKIRGAENRAKIAKLTVDMKTIDTRSLEAQINTNKKLSEITNSECTSCSCSPSDPRYNFPPNHACRTNWKSAIDRIAQAAGEGSASVFYNDPRNSPYALDENEGAFGHIKCSTATIDRFGSVGSDGIYNTNDDIVYCKLFSNK